MPPGFADGTSAMMARSLSTLLVSVLMFGSGCCCMPCGNSCGPCGPRSCCFCLPCLPKPIVWNGCCNDCGPSQCESCDQYCGGGCGIFGGQGLLPGLRGCMSCGRGCSEIYINEWISDPPDCCDPCDKCCGNFTGPNGNCYRGPFVRLLSALHGYSYCPPPNCGPWRPIFGHCNPCGPGGGSSCGGGCSTCGGGGCSSCGGGGCSSCGGGPAHGADIYYEGEMPVQGMPVQRTPTQAMPSQGTQRMPSNRMPQAAPMPQGESTSILEENWDMPKAKPVPGKPIHSAQQPPRGQMGYRAPRQMTQAQMAAAKAAQQKRAAIGNGVRGANYEQ
jgi:hypothetical protein